MLVLKYFAAVGTVLTAALLALNAYLEPSESAAPARVLRTATAASLIVTPRPQARVTVEPAIAQPKVAAAPPTHPPRHPSRAQ
jgi:hypothetical protein